MPEQAARIELLVAAGAVAAVLLHEVQRLVGTIQRAGRIIVLADPGIADADGDVADLGKRVLRNVPTEALQHDLHGGLVGGAEENHEFLATEAEQDIAPTKAGAHLLGQQQDHLVAIYMPRWDIAAVELIDDKN